jgi:outer membrane receptor protein involved in Fe transport
VDFRDSAIQANYYVTSNSTAVPTARFKSNRASNAVNATDYGLFAQASRSWKKVQESAAAGQRGVAYKLDLGLRFDSNQVRPSEVVEIAAPNGTTVLRPVEDFGDFLSPRAAFAVTFGRRDAQGSLTRPLILKTLFSRSLQQPSNYQRFASEPFVREIPSPGLGREDASNIELSLDWEARSNDRLRFNASIYRAKYNDVLQTALVIDSCCTPLRTGQFKPAGDFVVKGAELSMSAAWRRYLGYLNYTYTRALSGDIVNDEYGDPLPSRALVGDIARHKLNAGIEATAFGWLEGSLRLNAVGARPNAFEGPLTTSRQNFREVPAYARLNATFGARHAASGTTIQLSLNNLLDQDIWDSGVRSAEIYGFVGRIPQPGFNWMVRAIWDFHSEGSRSR